MNAPTSHHILVDATPGFTVSAHPDHHRILHVTVDPVALQGFLEDVQQYNVQNLEYVPFMRFHMARALRQRLGDALCAKLVELVKDRAHGGFTIGLQGVTTQHEDFVKFGTAVSHLLGPSNHDSMSGTYYARFKVKHTDNSDSYLRQAYRLFTMHTDGTFVSEATDWLLMMKFSEMNAQGGDSRFLHLDDWSELKKFASNELGTKPFLYKSPGSKNVEELVQRPLFFQTKFGLSISFIDQFVQPKNAGEAAFLQTLSESMETSSGTKEVRLPVGDLVVLNNYFYLHGRAPFKEHVDLSRELMRQRGTFSSFAT